MGPEPLGGSYERRKVPLPWELPSTAGRSARTDRALRRLREKYSRWLVAGRTEKDQHRWSWPPHCTTAEDVSLLLVCTGAGCWNSTSVDCPGERTGLAAQRQSAAWLRPPTGVCKRQEAGRLLQPTTAASLSFLGTHGRCSSTSKRSVSVQVPVGGPHVEVGLKSEPRPGVFGGFTSWRLCKLSALRTCEGITGTPVGVQVWH